MSEEDWVLLQIKHCQETDITGESVWQFNSQALKSKPTKSTNQRWSRAGLENESVFLSSMTVPSAVQIEQYNDRDTHFSCDTHDIYKKNNHVIGW